MGAYDEQTAVGALRKSASIYLGAMILLLLVDAAMCFWGIQVVLQHRESANEESDDSKLNYAKLSRTIDSFFYAPAHPPESSQRTFFISLLALVLALLLGAAELFGATLFVMQTTPNTTDFGKCLKLGYVGYSSTYRIGSSRCPFENIARSNDSHVVPPDVRQWLSTSSDTASEMDHLMIHSDGSLIFQWRDASVLRYDPSTRSVNPISGFSGLKYQVAMAGYSENGTSPYSVICGLTENQEYDGEEYSTGGRLFCLTERTPGMVFMDSVTPTPAEGELHSRDEIRNIYLENSTALWVARDFYIRGNSAIAENSELWFVDVEALNSTRVIATSKPITTKRDNPTETEKCDQWGWLMVLNAFVTLTILGGCMFLRDLPSFSAPLSLGLYAVAVRAQFIVGNFVAWLVSCVFIVKLVRTKSSGDGIFVVEGLAWTFYGTMGSMLVISLVRGMQDPYYMLDDGGFFAFVSIATIAVGALVLNHPILEIISIALGAVGGLAAIFCLLNPVMLGSVAAISAVLSLGFGATAKVLRVYRLHIFVYGRRCWRFCKKSCAIENLVIRNNEEINYQ